MPEASASIELLRGVGFVALCGAAFTVGGHMLRLWRRTGQLPELAMGSHILLLIAGYVLEFAGLAGQGFLGESGAAAARAAGNLCYASCIFAYLLFSWRVFRPGSRLAAATALGGGAAMALGWTGEVMTGSFELVPARFALPWFWIAYLPRLVCMAWAAGEGFAHWGRLRRRMRLGLESPLLVNRFLLWGLAACAELAIYFVAGLALVGDDPSGFLVGAHALVISAMGVAASATIFLAFQPPAAYRRWVEGRAGR